MLWQDLSWTDVMDALRAQTVPSGYLIHTWKPGLSLYVGKACSRIHVHAFMCVVIGQVDRS